MALLLFTSLFSVLLTGWLLYKSSAHIRAYPTTSHYKWALSCIILLVPFCLLGLYNKLGSPLLPARPFEKFVVAVEARNPSEQLVQAQVLSQRNPHDADALKKLGRLFMSNGYWQDAFLTHKRLVAQHGITDGLSEGERNGLNADEKNDLSEGVLSPFHKQQELWYFIAANISLIEARIKQNPQDREAWLMLVRAYHVLGMSQQKDAACTRAKEALTTRNITDFCPVLHKEERIFDQP